MDELIKKVELWAEVRKLHTADPKAQTLKVIEEFTEAFRASEDYEVGKSTKLEEHYKEELMDGIGDTYVTLIILSKQLDLDFREILNEMYHGGLGENIVYALNRLSTGMSKGHIDTITEGIRSILLILNAMELFAKVDAVDCLQLAYNEIKDRKGMMIDGTFVKYEDLAPEQQKELDEKEG